MSVFITLPTYIRPRGQLKATVRVLLFVLLSVWLQLSSFLISCMLLSASHVGDWLTLPGASCGSIFNEIVVIESIFHMEYGPTQ